MRESRRREREGREGKVVGQREGEGKRRDRAGVVVLRGIDAPGTSSLRWEGLVKKVGFEPGVNKRRSYLW